MCKTDEINVFVDLNEWSSQWEMLLKQSQPYYPQDIPLAVSTVLPLPERNETLTFYKGGSCHKRMKTLSTLLHEEETLMMYNYSLTTQVIQRSNCFMKQKLPLLHPTYVLFPLDAPHHSTWLNPLNIIDVWENEGRTYVKMATGPGLIVKLSKRTIMKYAANALLIWACFTRDLPLLGKNLCTRPLDVLPVPDTKFMEQLSKHVLLQAFPIDIHQFRHILLLESIRHEFMNERFAIDWDGLTFRQLTEEIAKL